MGPGACSDLATSIQMPMCVQTVSRKASVSERLIALVGFHLCQGEELLAGVCD